MKQLLILSGKAEPENDNSKRFYKAVCSECFADCDVDAPNLHLVMAQNSKPKLTDYYGMPKSEIAADKCVKCGLCKESCRFDAISSENGYKVDPFACEGCGVCELVCPAGAVTMKPALRVNLCCMLMTIKSFRRQR
jgi:MinD superfamily P-loop ATPase